MQTGAPTTQARVRPDTLAMEIFSLARDTVLDALVESWPQPEAKTIDTAAADDIDAPEQRTVYRIQLFTSIRFADAAAVRDEATSDFGQEVRVDFETPYYKVRVGSFDSAQKAESLLQSARQLGYRGAWVVRVRASQEDE